MLLAERGRQVLRRTVQPTHSSLDLDPSPRILRANPTAHDLSQHSIQLEAGQRSRLARKVAEQGLCSVHLPLAESLVFLDERSASSYVE